MMIYQRINKLWRIFATGFCFSLFGIGGLTLTFIVFPLLTFSSKNNTARELKVQKIIVNRSGITMLSHSLMLKRHSGIKKTPMKRFVISSFGM